MRGEDLRELRSRMALTLEDMAAAIGCTAKTLSRQEKLKTVDRTIELAAKAAWHRLDRMV